MKTEVFSPSSHPFKQTIEQAQTFVLQRIQREINDKQLYYHTFLHTQEVQTRSRQILALLSPYCLHCYPETLARHALLLDLCAIAHDMVQIFIQSDHPHASRRREMGMSEKATIKELLDYIEQINPKIETEAQFTLEDKAIIKEAILATICDYNPEEGAIYQPYLYQTSVYPCLVPQILALADIGSLGMKGIETYNQEGSLLFLEENPDIIPLVLNQKIHHLPQENPELANNLKQRLLRRTNFQINFAKSRLNRISSELFGLPPEQINPLKQAIFPYLTPNTIEQLEKITPTHQETSLKTLVDFFNFEAILAKISVTQIL